MEDDLNNSLRMLDHVVNTQSRGLLKNALLKDRTPKKKKLDLSLTLRPEEFGLNQTEFDQTFTSILDCNKTLTGTVIRNEPWRSSIDVLYLEFLEVLQTRTPGSSILEVVADLQRCCADALNVLKALKSKVHVQKLDEEVWLENERNIWRLLFILYQDRLNSMMLQENNDDDDNGKLPYFGRSEKKCVENLFQRDQLIRESQLVIDWLESCACLRDDNALHLSDSTMGWENTLHDLKMKNLDEDTQKQMVTHLDPDAPHYEKLPLHSTDMEDERILCYKIFTKIRCGKLEEAQKICENCGHGWRAAMLEGWRLYHNPNIVERSREKKQIAQDEAMAVDSDTENSQNDEEGFEVALRSEEDWETEDIEGNENRDIWKNMAWKYVEQNYLNKHEKAAVAAYSGCLKPLLTVSSTWEDYLWSYMKVLVDIRVESEIRDNVCKNYRPLPSEYWDQKMSINEVFACLESSKNQNVSLDAAKSTHIIEKLIILDEIEKLMSKIEEWIEESTITTHFLRFVTHLVLFFEQIGQTQRRDVIERVLESYITRLMQMNETQLVAFYISKMGSHAQVQMYASYLEKFTDNNERIEALELGEACGLNIRAIAVRVVENIQNLPHAIESSGNLQQKITEVDELKISALDWVLFFEDQKSEALSQSNGLIFTFLALRKLDAAQLVFNKLPTDIIDHLLSEGDVSENLNQAINEHLSYKTYLDAQEGFNNWFKMFKSCPIAPLPPPEHAQFTEKVAYEHQVSQYKAETERWKITTADLAKTAKALLYNVLLFPKGGWLNGAKDADFLRSTCIPECVLLLYSVLFESNQHKECVQLADILASNKQLYEVYSKEKLMEIVMKLYESSVVLSKQKKDPWGNDLSD